MCLGIPGKVVELNGDKAMVDYGGGTIREANASLVNVKIGDYVIVHAGFIIEKMNEEEANGMFDAWQEIFGGL